MESPSGEGSKENQNDMYKWWQSDGTEQAEHTEQWKMKGPSGDRVMELSKQYDQPEHTEQWKNEQWLSNTEWNQIKTAYQVGDH